ncbi:MAG: hypothetical protein HYX34_12665 [Actinobacteria bacterium]|nr:hypothetical protein [Actinomycetota bacterium]
MIAGLAGATTLTVFGVAAAGSDAAPSTGRLPASARGANGVLNVEALPDLVAVEDGRQVVVGYAKKGDLYPSGGGNVPRNPAEASASSGPGSGVVSVWDRTGTRLRGHLYPDGVGYLSLGEEAAGGVSPASPPVAEAPATTVAGS